MTLPPKKIAPAAIEAQITEYWSPKMIGQVNDTAIKLVKLQGEFCWHHHEREDELFWVLSGKLFMHFRDRVETLLPGEFIIVPKGMEHCPVAAEETLVVLIEPATTLNTGNVENELTRHSLETLNSL